MINAVMMLMLWGQIGEEFYWAERLKLHMPSSYTFSQMCFKPKIIGDMMYITFHRCEE